MSGAACRSRPGTSFATTSWPCHRARERERLRALLSLLYRSGLRRAELSAATVQSLKSHSDDDGEIRWDLEVVGKGVRMRTEPIASPAVEALKDYFECRFGDLSLPVSNAAVPLAATLPLPGRPRRAMSAWAINAAVSEAFLKASRELADHRTARSPRELRTASAYWLRHTFATHALKYDDARLDVLEKILGHASITSTANNYVDEDREMRQEVVWALARRVPM